MSKRLKLGVNVDHVATVRQARGGYLPSPLEAAKVCARVGAHAITVHLREDRRHIQDHDVYDIRKQVDLPLNLEMGNNPEIIAIAQDVQPDEICLVPERREELTTEGGLDVIGHYDELAPTVEQFLNQGIVVSPFVDPSIAQIDACHKLGVKCVELHTGEYCLAYDEERTAVLKPLVDAAKHAHSLGIQVNAGHGINLDNLYGVLEIPHLDTLNIGHSIIARSIFSGMKTAVREMLEAIADY